MTGADLHMLAGAYALGALDEAERRAFEGHLATCEACAVEVSEFLATAARLGLAVAEAPPAAMKQQVLHRIAQVRQDPPEVAVPAPPDGRHLAGPARRRTSFALAAAVAAAVGLGGVAAWQIGDARSAHEQAAHAEREAARIAAVLTAPDAHAVTGTAGGAGGGTRVTVVTSHSQNQAVFLSAGLPELSDGRTYELWFDDAGVMRPAGLVPPGGGSRAVLVKGLVGPAVGVGITVEPAGGSPRPTSAPLAVLAFAAP